MRILSISPNFNQNRNVSFGIFAKGDDNARTVVREALTAKPDESYMQPAYDTWFKRIENDENFIAYTSKSDVIKGKFDEEFVRKNKDNKYLMLRINMLKKQGHLEENINDLKSL